MPHNRHELNTEDPYQQSVIHTFYGLVFVICLLLMGLTLMVWGPGSSTRDQGYADLCSADPLVAMRSFYDHQHVYVDDDNQLVFTSPSLEPWPDSQDDLVQELFGGDGSQAGCHWPVVWHRDANLGMTLEVEDGQLITSPQEITQSGRQLALAFQEAICQAGIIPWKGDYSGVMAYATKKPRSDDLGASLDTSHPKIILFDQLHQRLGDTSSQGLEVLACQLGVFTGEQEACPDSQSEDPEACPGHGVTYYLSPDLGLIVEPYEEYTPGHTSRPPPKAETIWV